MDEYEPVEIDRPVVTNNRIYNNRALNGGGVRFCYFLTPGTEPLVANNVIVRNEAENGGGVHVYEAYPNLVHNTIADNEAARGGGLFAEVHSTPAFTDSILFGDTAPTGLEIYVDGTSSLGIDFCDVLGGPGGVYLEPGAILDWGIFNFDEDPLFVDPIMLDYHLQAGSPCVDRGIDVGVDDDMDGDVRPLGEAVDIGADEFVPGGVCFLSMMLPVT